MGFENITTAKDEGVYTLTISRPGKLNALNIATINEIGAAVKEAVEDPEVFGMIITGEGNKAFAAGADISEFSNFDQRQGQEMSEKGHQVFNQIENSPKPVIAAVNGFALGGGCELAMACHLRVASNNALFGQPEANLGIIPGYGGTQRLTQLIGKSKALEFLMTTEKITSAQAENLGLINYDVEPANLISTCHFMLHKMRKKSPMALARIIKCVNDHFSKETGGFQSEQKAFGECFETPDFKEGVSAFLEKRKPDFNRL